VLDDDIAPPVPQKPEKRLVFVLFGDGIANLDNAPVAAVQQFDLVAGGILKEEPGFKDGTLAAI
jgi:hypothetical protein